MNHILAAMAATWVIAVPVFAQETPTMCTMQYQPVCGTCTGGDCATEYKTYGNACVMGAEGGTFVHEGECAVSEPTTTPEQPIIAPEHIEVAEQVIAVLEEQKPESFWNGLWNRLLSFLGLR